MKHTQELIRYCLLSILCFFYVSAYSYVEVTENDFTVWIDRSNMYAIVKNYSGTNSSIVFPSSVVYNGTTYSVTQIKCTDLPSTVKSITIPSSITSIVYGLDIDTVKVASITDWCKIAFASYDANPLAYGCKFIVNGVEQHNITVPDDVTEIKKYAFAGYYGGSITIGTKVTSVGTKAFRNVPKVFCLNNSIPSGFASSGGLVNYVSNTVDASGDTITNARVYSLLSSMFIVDGMKYIPTSMTNRTCDLVDCTYDTSYKTLNVGRTVTYKTIAFTVNKINSYACYRNSKYTGTATVNNTDSVEDHAFYGCKNITALTVSNDAIVGDYAFAYCTGLKSATVNNGNSIGAGSFYYSGNTMTVDITNKGNIGKSAFANASMSTVTVSNSGDVDERAFANAKMNTMTISNSGNVAHHSFYGSKISTKVTVNNIGTLGYSSFKNTTGTFTAILNTKDTSIEDSLFYGSTVTSVDMSGATSTSISAYAFDKCSALTSFKFNSAVTSLGDSAFAKCVVLPTITLPNSLVTIGNSGFADCSKLANVSIGSGCTTISLEAFKNCVVLPKIVIPVKVTNIGNSTFSGCAALKTVIFNHAATTIQLGYNTSTKTGMFYDCPLDSVYIGRRLSYTTTSTGGYSPFYASTTLRAVAYSTAETKIYDNEFNGCTNLQKVTVGTSIASAGASAFYNCSKLPSIYLPTSVKTLGKSCFQYCTSLKSVTLLGVTKMGTYVFANCTSLPELSIPSTTTALPQYAFQKCTALKKFYIQDRTTTLSISTNETGTTCKYYLSGDGFPIFSDCPLDTVYIGGNISYDTIQSKGYSPFYHVTKLRSVRIGDNVTSMPANEFYLCTGLKNVWVGDGVTTIHQWVCSGCSALNYFSFGKAVTSIGVNAFSDCTAMTQFVSGATTPPTCGTQALDDINKWDCTLTIPNGTTSKYADADQWKEFLFLEEKTMNICVDGIYYAITSTTDKTVKVTYGSKSYNSYKGSVSIPSTVVIDNVTYNVTEIGDSAFYKSTGLTDITIPSSITSIANRAFTGCESTSFNAVYITDLAAWCNISMGGMYDACPLYIARNLYLNGELVTNLTITSEIPVVKYRTFYGCTSLKYLSVDTKVEKAFPACTGIETIVIGEHATINNTSGNDSFEECSGVKDVYIQRDIWTPTALFCQGSNAKIHVYSNKLSEYQANSTWAKFTLTDDFDNPAAGSLSTIVGTNPTSLKVSGDLNGTDIKYLRSLINDYSLTSLDMSEANIVAGGEAYNTSYPTYTTTANHIGYCMFQSCSKLEAISLPKKVSVIGFKAFSGCKALSSVDIPEGLLQINVYAFEACNISNITLPQSLLRIDASAFFSNSLKTVTIPKNVSVIGIRPFGKNTSLTEILVDEDNAYYTSVDGVLYNKAMTELIQYPTAKAAHSDIVIPDGVTSIWKLALDALTMKSVDLPATLTSVADQAFRDCTSLTTVTCRAVTCPTLTSTSFQNVTTANVTLKVPNASVDAYKADQYWLAFNIEAKREIRNIIDGTEYANTVDSLYDQINYTRTFTASNVNKWQALYLPFSFNVSDYTDQFDVAEIFAFCPYMDTDGDGEVTPDDGDMLVLFKKTSGNTVPNVPYLLRPKTAGTYTISAEDATLYAAKDGYVTCATTKRNFTITGLNKSVAATAANGLWYVSGGYVSHRTSGSATVKPNRWVMSIESRSDNYAAEPQAVNAKGCPIVVIGEDIDDLTGISGIGEDKTNNKDMIYHIDGTRVESTKNLQKGIYIINGKKTYVK